MPQQTWKKGWEREKTFNFFSQLCMAVSHHIFFYWTHIRQNAVFLSRNEKTIQWITFGFRFFVVNVMCCWFFRFFCWLVVVCCLFCRVLVFRSIEDGHKFLWGVLCINNSYKIDEHNNGQPFNVEKIGQIEFGWMVFNCQKIHKNDHVHLSHAPFFQPIFFSTFYCCILVHCSM